MGEEEEEEEEEEEGSKSEDTFLVCHLQYFRYGLQCYQCSSFVTLCHVIVTILRGREEGRQSVPSLVTGNYLHLLPSLSPSLLLALPPSFPPCPSSFLSSFFLLLFLLLSSSIHKTKCFMTAGTNTLKLSVIEVNIITLSNVCVTLSSIIQNEKKVFVMHSEIRKCNGISGN